MVSAGGRGAQGSKPTVRRSATSAFHAQSGNDEAPFSIGIAPPRLSTIKGGTSILRAGTFGSNPFSPKLNTSYQVHPSRDWEDLKQFRRFEGESRLLAPIVLRISRADGAHTVAQ